MIYQRAITYLNFKKLTENSVSKLERFVSERKKTVDIKTQRAKKDFDYQVAMIKGIKNLSLCQSLN